MKVLGWLVFIGLYAQMSFASGGIGMPINQSYCVSCFNGNGYPYNMSPSMPTMNPYNISPISFYQPWWYPYSAMNFTNYNYPGVWSWPGLQGSYYPGHGNMGVGKPNVYIYGPIGTHFTIHIDLKHEGNILSSFPPLSEGWKGTLVQNGIEFDGITYPYYYYDFRSNNDSLQSSHGFCSHGDLVEEMAQVLKQLHFSEQEIHDFKSYWYFKLPMNEEYCVYPQLNEEVEKVANLSCSPELEQKTRIFFLIVPSLALANDNKEKFRHRPSEKWVTPAIPKPTREKFILREWGIGFLAI